MRSSRQGGRENEQQTSTGRCSAQARLPRRSSRNIVTRLKKRRDCKRVSHVADNKRWPRVTREPERVGLSMALPAIVPRRWSAPGFHSGQVASGPFSICNCLLAAPQKGCGCDQSGIVYGSVSQTLRSLLSRVQSTGSGGSPRNTHGTQRTSLRSTAHNICVVCFVR